MSIFNGFSLGSNVGIIIFIAIIAIVIIIRIYIMRHRGGRRAKCPNCGAVFDASHNYSVIHFGTMNRIKCPACGKSSFMSTYVKDPITWPPKERTAGRPGDILSEEELENKRIEDSKYEKS